MKMRMNVKPSLFLVVGTLVLTVAVIAGTVLFTKQAQFTTKAVYQAQRPYVGGADWPEYLMGPSNSSYNAKEHTLSPENIAQLALVGDVDIGTTAPYKDAIATQVIVVGSTLYFGSWNGYEYAVDAVTSNVLWHTYLGVTHPSDPQCYPQFAGVTSAALVHNGVVYVGGGDGNFYALSATTGKILWKTPLTSTADGGFLWSSPSYYDGAVYMGIASYGDCPLVRASVVKMDPKTGKIVARHWTDTTNEIGDSVWSKISIADGMVVFGTGNGYNTTNPNLDAGESDSIVAVRASDMGEPAGGVYHPPYGSVEGDYDFGASCMRVPDVGGGNPGALCHNKNGELYAVRVTANGLALQWMDKLGNGGEGPEHGEADISSGVFDGHTAYFMSAHIDYDKHYYNSAIYAIDPTTGAFRWVTPFTGGYPLNALAGANGLLAVGLSQKLHNGDFAGNFMVVSMADGRVLFQQQTSAAIFGSPTIANGSIYVPTIDGHIYIYGLPGNLPAYADFTTGQQPQPWSWVGQDAQGAQFTKDGLHMDVQSGGIDQHNFLTLAAPPADFSLQATLIFTPKSDGDEADLVAYHDGRNYLVVAVQRVKGQMQFVMRMVQNGVVTQSQPVAVTATAGGAITLQIVHLPFHYYGYATVDGIHMLTIGEFDPHFLPTLVGLTTQHIGTGVTGSALWLRCTVTAL